MIGRARIRRSARAVRDEFAQRASGDIAWPEALLRSINDLPRVAGYCAIGSEVPLDGLLSRLRARNVAICLPYFADRGATMIFRLCGGDRGLERSPFGFLQPSGAAPEVIPDALFVPMLAFDRKGNRLGQGGGHYDRYLSRHNSALRIGTAWSCQELPAIAAQPWDVPMHAIATEQEWIDIRMTKDRGD